MEGPNKFRIRTNIVNMPAGLFVVHSFVTFYAGYEFCKHAVLRKLYERKGDDNDAEYRTDEEQNN